MQCSLLSLLIIGPFLAEIAHQSPYRTGMLFLPLFQIGMSQCATIGRKCVNFGTKAYLEGSITLPRPSPSPSSALLAVTPPSQPPHWRQPGGQSPPHWIVPGTSTRGTAVSSAEALEGGSSAPHQLRFALGKKRGEVLVQDKIIFRFH